MTGELKYGSVWRIPSPIYPPLQAAAHRAQHLMPTPRAHFIQALTRGPGPTLQSAPVGEVVAQWR
jgi:hypothetical protein